MPTFAQYFVGVVRIPAANLIFVPSEDAARQEKAQDILKLVQVFRDTGLDPSHLTHQIFGLITPRELGKLRRAACVSPDDLLQTAISGRIPLVSGEYEVLCVEGRRRVEAAKLLLADDAWWTVRLHCIQDSRERKAVLSSFSGSTAYEATYSDGDIYCKLRYHQGLNDDQSVRGWKTMLSECKGRAWDHLLPRANILAALDRVMSFPGMRSGFQLGNIDKHLATHCDEQIVRYLDHIYRVWDLMVCGGGVDTLVVDDSTVRLLQLRAPSVSKTDRLFICLAMDDGRLFPGVTEPNARKRLYHTLISLNLVIPSLETFHENMKYITIGAKIIKKHLDVPTERSGCHIRVTTLLQRLTDHWNPDCLPLIEVSEGYFMHLQAPTSPDLAFKQLFISVLRQFPFLSTDAALRDFRSEAMPAYTDQHRLRLLFLRAKRLGYENIKIREGLQRPNGHIDLVQTPFEATHPVPLADWRGGKPFVRTLLALERSSFLPTLGLSDISCEGVTPEFVQNDMMTAFFGTQKYQIDTSKPGISILEGSGVYPPVTGSVSTASSSAAEGNGGRTRKTPEPSPLRSKKSKLRKDQVKANSKLRHSKKMHRRKTQTATLVSDFPAPELNELRSALELPVSTKSFTDPGSICIVPGQVPDVEATEDLPLERTELPNRPDDATYTDDGSVIGGEAPLHLNSEVGEPALPHRSPTRSVLEIHSGDTFDQAVDLSTGGVEQESGASVLQDPPLSLKRAAALLETPPTLRSEVISPDRPMKRIRTFREENDGSTQFDDVPLTSAEIPQTARLPVIDNGPRTPLIAFGQYEEEL